MSERASTVSGPWEPTHRHAHRRQRHRARARSGVPGMALEPPRRGPARDDAIERLHALLLRGARFEVGRRQASLPHLRGARARRHRPRGGRRRADERAQAPRRLPRAQPVHDLGLQVRALRGSREAAPPRLAGARGADGAGRVGSRLERRASSPIRRPSRRSCWRRSSRRSTSSSRPTSAASSIALAVNGVPIDVLAERLGTTGARSTRPCTTPGASCAGSSPATDTPSARHWRHRNDATCIRTPRRTAARPGRSRDRLRRLLRRARPVRRPRAAGQRRRCRGPRHERPPRRLPGLPRGAREPARARRRSPEG